MQVWSAFVDAFVNTCQAQGSALARSPFAPGPRAPEYLPPVDRLVAVGDLHGDIDKTLRAFRLAGLIDNKNNWAGGTTTVVQVKHLVNCIIDILSMQYIVGLLHVDTHLHRVPRLHRMEGGDRNY